MQKMSEWISVKDRVPDNFKTVLIFISNEAKKNKRDELIEQTLLARYCYCSGWKAIFDKTADTFIFFNKDGSALDHHCRKSFSGLYDVTHWMPLPESPK